MYKTATTRESLAFLGGVGTLVEGSCQFHQCGKVRRTTAHSMTRVSIPAEHLLRKAEGILRILHGLVAVTLQSITDVAEEPTLPQTYRPSSISQKRRSS